ncbi:MAG: lysylphosphatidylglycerol synthase transmembrane domain-containing protein [Coriobacteriales bacterium]|nr:lysylphosphatidylglycerol synthase transmembrane domain-containing protein [Coriobacteriales bacterium]
MATQSDKRSEHEKKRHVALKVGGSKGSIRSGDEEAENKAKARKGALFLGAVVILYLLYLIFSGQMGMFVDALGRVDLGWVGLGAVCYLAYFFFGVMAYAIAVYIDHDSPVGVRDLMSVEASGIFFGNLTPMMAGAVPSQIVRLTRTGLDVGEASATQFTRFIMFQFGVVLFAAIMLVAKLGFFFQTYGDIVILNLVVFAVHFLELAGLFVICLCPGFVMRVGNGLIKFLSKRGWLKNVDHWNEVVNVQVMEFSNAFMTAAKDLPSMGLTLLVTMLQLASFYMIPWFVLRAFGITADFLNCLAAGSMVQMVATAVPLPGGTGGTEGSFFMFYGPMFGAASMSAGFIVWRILTFFAPTVLSAPLLGLRSRNRSLSIYQRVERVKGRLLGTGKGSLSAAATVHPKRKK